MKKIILLLTMILITNTIAMNVKAADDVFFNDVPNSHWAKDNIKKLVELGIVNGYKDGSFKPNKNINVDAFIKLIVTGLGYTEIKNAEGYWATNYINKALELSIIEDGQFDKYNRIISREEMASITAKALGQVEEKKDIQEDYTFIRNSINDFYNISDKYLQDVVESYHYGIITGKPNGFDPKGTATRAEAVTVIVRLLDKSCRMPIFIPPLVTESDIKKDQDGKMFFDVIRYRDYKNEDERIATEIKHKYRIFESSKGEPTALQLMYAMNKVYRDNTGYVHLGQLGNNENPIGVGYFCLDSIEHSYDVVECSDNSEVDFYISHSKYESASAYNIILNYNIHNMSYIERFNKYEKMFDTMLYYLYENDFFTIKDTIKEILQIAENMDVYQYNYTIKINDREMYVVITREGSIELSITTKGGKIEHYYPVEENKPDTKVKTDNINQLAANFTLNNIYDEEYCFDNSKKKKVYIMFWASWCHYCIDRLNEIDNLAQQDNDFEVITIVSPNYSKEKDTEEFKKWFENLGYTNMNVLLDENGSIAELYNITAYPTNIYIDNGIIVKKNIGHISNSQMNQQFE
jgi:thiol-disulfide isomerase/thioredoxin